MQNLFTNKKLFRFAALLGLWLMGSKAHAQTDQLYLDSTITIGAGETMQWYSNVTLGPACQLYIEDGASIQFYGANFKIMPGAKIYGSATGFGNPTQGMGSGKIVFMQANPMDGSSVQQTLDGGNSGNPANATQNTIPSIEINNSLGVKLVNTDLRIGSNLNFVSGHLYADVKNVVMGASATITGVDQNKFVVTASSGFLAREGVGATAVPFPVGSSDVAGDYLPDSLTNAGTVDRYDVRAIASLTPAATSNAANYLTRSWQIVEATAGGSNVTLSMQHNTASNQGASYTDASAIILSSPLTAAWAAASASATTRTGGSVTGSSVLKVAGITDFTTNTYFTKGVLANGVLVSTKVLLQGAVSGTAMTTSLNTQGLIPTTQPYNKAPYNYTGTESVASIPAGVTDWVLVDVRDANTPSTIIATRAAFVKSDGTVVDLDGSSAVSFSRVTAGNYFVSVRHRNHLAIRTAAAQALSSTATLYDFTTGQSKAYQNAGITNNAAMKDLGNGKFAMWGGDGTANGKVSYTGLGNDEFFLYTTTLGGVSTTVLSPVYHNADYNMNGKVNYTGLGNDEFFIFTTVLGGVSTAVLNQHL